MERRTLLSILGAGALAGCTGNSSTGTTTKTATKTATATPTPTPTDTATPTPTPVAGEDIDPQQEYASDEQGLLTDVMAARIYSWAYSSDIRYYDSESESVKEYVSDETVFLTAFIGVVNLGGEPLDTPSYESFSVRYDNEDYGPTCSLPEGISFENLREQGNEYAISEPDCNFATDDEELKPEEERYLTTLIEFPSPEQDFFIKWETTKMNTEFEPTYFRFEVDDT